MEGLCPEFKKRMAYLHGENGKRRCAWIEFLAAQPFNGCVTLQPNRSKIAYETLRRLVGRWLKFVDNAFIGRQHRKTPELRLKGFFHNEFLTPKPHAHGLLTIPARFFREGKRMAIIRIKMQFAWKKLIPGGDVKFDICDSRIASARYHTKEFERWNFWETIIDAEEFWPCANDANKRFGADRRL